MFALFAPPGFLDGFLLRFFSGETVNYVVWPFIQIGAVITLVAAWAAYASYLERKISAFMQARLGPMRVGPWGLLQPIADAIKLLTKEDFIPDKADRGIFFVAPYIAVASAFIVMAVIPFAPDWGIITDVNIGLLFARTLSLSGMVNAQSADSIWFVFYQPVGFLIFLVSGIAENNRAPFDLPEAESELVAGFHTEYSGMRWSLFFMAEYAAMVVVSAIATAVYLGGWDFPFVYRFTEVYHQAALANGNPEGAPLYHGLYVIIGVIVFMLKMGVLLYVYFW